MSEMVRHLYVPGTTVSSVGVSVGRSHVSPQGRAQDSSVQSQRRHQGLAVLSVNVSEAKNLPHYKQ